MSRSRSLSRSRSYYRKNNCSRNSSADSRLTAEHSCHHVSISRCMSRAFKRSSSRSTSSSRSRSYQLSHFDYLSQDSFDEIRDLYEFDLHHLNKEEMECTYNVEKLAQKEEKRKKVQLKKRRKPKNPPRIRRKIPNQKNRVGRDWFTSTIMIL